MKIGVNWTSPRETTYISKLLKSGKVDYIEILIDNFAHFNPKEIKKFLGNTDVAIHIMASNFLNESNNKLIHLANVIKRWVNTLEPIYISDHLGSFEYKGSITPILTEINYNEHGYLFEKIYNWSRILNSKLFFENYASYLPQEKSQVDFFDCLINEVSAGLLFDFSNAIVAENNNVEIKENWLPLLKSVRHFHCGSFQEDESGTSDNGFSLCIDSHDREINLKSIQWMHDLLPKLCRNCSITLERDFNKSCDNWCRDYELIFSK